MKELSRAEYYGLNQARRAKYMFGRGVQWGADGSLFSVPLIAFSAATAQRGEKLSAATAAASSIATFPAIQGVIAAGLSLIPGIGQGGAIFLSMFAAAYPSGLVDTFVSRSVRTFSQFGLKQRRLETGQSWVDTEFAAQTRYNAQMELSASIQSTRRYLGQEAQILHQ